MMKLRMMSILQKHCIKKERCNYEDPESSKSKCKRDLREAYRLYLRTDSTGNTSAHEGLDRLRTATLFSETVGGIKRIAYKHCS
jgi:hypothetical protein